MQESKRKAPTSTAPANAGRGKRRLIQLLSQPTILEEAGPPRSLTHLLTVVSLLLVGAIAWAGIVEMRETAVTQGQVMPAGSVYLVQHLEGGIVAEILVREGDVVERDQLLVRMQAAAAAAELDQLRSREASLALKAERLRAFVLDRAPDFSAGAGNAGLVADQRAILDMQIEARDSQRAVLRSRSAQRDAELEALGERKTILESQLRVMEQQDALRAGLADKGLLGQATYLDSQKSLIESRGDLASIVGDIARTRAAQAEARNSLIELDATLRNDALNEVGSVTAELAQVREASAKLEDRVRRLRISAPARGVIKGLAVNTIGGVIAPGETMMEIVPFDEALVAEVQIAPRDIGHLRIGQAAQVKVTTYDVARFGAVEGKLQHISASTFVDEAGEPFYKGIIGLQQSYVGDQPAANPILPGMVVDADINTGSKSLLAYLLRPVYRGLRDAFHER